MAKQIIKGDIVRYSNEFCKRAMIDYDLARRKGTVVDVKPIGKNLLVKVKWEGSEEVEGSLACNLARMAHGWPHTFVE